MGFYEQLLLNWVDCTCLLYITNDIFIISLEYTMSRIIEICFLNTIIYHQM